MIKFIDIIKDLIVETSRFEFIYDKYIKSENSEINLNDLIKIIEADPTSNLPKDLNVDNFDSFDFNKIKVGKYAQWIIKNYLTSNSKNIFIEDLYKLNNDLNKFERFKNRLPQEHRDINQLTPETLYDQVKDFSLEKTKATADEKKEASKTYQHPGGEIVYKGSQWTVIEISDQGQLGKDAACFYGGYHLEPKNGETRWCTSSPGLNFFDEYIKDGSLYVIIPNSPTKFTSETEIGVKSGLPALRYQFHFPSNQYMDPADRQIDLVDFLSKQESGIKEFFKNKFFNDKSLISEKNIFINHPNKDNVFSNFISLYGLDELLEKLPNTIENFKLSGNFSKIPETICNLQQLKLISLINNQELKDLPNCLFNLPNLDAINIKGTELEKIKLPNKKVENGIIYLNNNINDVKKQFVELIKNLGPEKTTEMIGDIRTHLKIEKLEDFLNIFNDLKYEKKRDGIIFFYNKNDILISYHDEFATHISAFLFDWIRNNFNMDRQEIIETIKKWLKNTFNIEPKVVASTSHHQMNR